jgi:hypothetical protein
MHLPALLIHLRALLLLIPLLSLYTAVHAQRSATGNWLMYFGSNKIAKGFNWHNEVQYRNYNLAGDIQQLLLRTGIGYNLSENNDNILLGYGFIRAYSYAGSGEKTSVPEHRIFQQFITRQNIHKYFIQHRYRLEERFLPNQQKVRFRYFLSVNRPVNKAKMETGAVYLSAYNEVMLHAARPVFDQNRLYGGAGYCISTALRVETGYMVQIQENRTRPQFQLMIFNNLSFTKD